MIITFDKKRYDMTTDDMMAVVASFHSGSWSGIFDTQWVLMRHSSIILTSHMQRAGMSVKDRPLGGEIDAEGVYRYPEDEPMYPYMKWETREGTVYFYPYSVMGIPTGSEHYAVRMD